MSTGLYFIAVILLNQALPTNLVVVGTIATALIIVVRLVIHYG